MTLSAQFALLPIAPREMSSHYRWLIEKIPSGALHRGLVERTAWIKKAARGGAGLPGGLSAESIADLWNDWRFAAALRMEGESRVNESWLQTQEKWRRLSEQSNPRPMLTALCRHEVMYSYSSQKLSDAEAAALIAAPAGSRAFKAVVGMSVNIDTSGAYAADKGIQYPKICESLLTIARLKFSAAQREMLMKAFANGSLDVAACLASDLTPKPDASATPLPAAYGAQRWMAEALERVQRAYGQGGAPRLTQWTQSLARAWAKQDPDAARSSIEVVLEQAMAGWEWEKAPKKSAPGGLTPQEENFIALVRRAAAMAEAAGVKLPKKALDALAAADSRGAKSKTEIKAERLAAEKAAQEQKASERPMDAEAIKGRQNVLRAAIDNLDVQAVAWCIENGLTGNRLIFSNGPSRGGPLDSVCGRNRWRKESEPRAVSILNLLIAGGFDFALECKAPRGKKHANPIQRGMKLAVNKEHGQGDQLLGVLALAQVRSCVKSGMALADLEAWRAEAENSKEYQQWMKNGTQNGAEAYLRAIGAVVEQLSLMEGVGLRKPADADEIDGGKSAAAVVAEPARAPRRTSRI